MASVEAINSSDLREAVLRSDQAMVSILNLGCITRDWRVMHNGTAVPVVLGYGALRDYLENPYFLGIIAGRVANRIGGAAYQLGGETIKLPANEGPNTLHGGHNGLGRRIWDMKTDGESAVHLSYHSPHGEEGFAGHVDFSVTISLDGTCLTYDMTGIPDRPTPINLAQHSYYNLAGRGQVWPHSLQVSASHCTPVAADGIPTGEILQVDGTRYDFRHERTLQQADPAANGTDVNLVLHSQTGPQASLTAPSGLQLRMWTDQPGLQVYTASGLGAFGTPLAGQQHGAFGAICLEPQKFPDSVNNSGFPSCICTPDTPYRQILKVDIAGL